MSKFNRGDKVINSFTKEKGVVIDVYVPTRGRQLYKVKYPDHEKDENSADLQPDVDLTDPFERCRQNYYDHYTEYLKENTIFKIRSSNNSTISSLKASRTLFKTYQFKPLLKFLNSENRRILIADEVGLGKTIEAGHIMLELKARDELRNALVICPVALRAKWKTELNEKFGLNFIEIEDKETLLHELRHHNGQVRAVINYDKVRENSEIINYIEEKNIKFSIIVCDESHKLRNDNTLIYRGTEKLLVMSDSVIFMSATPIMIDERNLYNQLHLLDPNNYDNREVFTNNLQLNKPFVRALSLLNGGVSLPIIKEELSQAVVTTINTINESETYKEFKIDEYFREYPIYQQIITNLSLGEDSPSIRAKIQMDLCEMSPMSNIFSRTRKRDVVQDWSQAERNPVRESVSLYPKERYAYDDALDNYTEEHTTFDEYGREHSGGLGLITFKRQLASSVWATLNDYENLDCGIDVYSHEKDSKFDSLLNIIKTVLSHGNKKLIVFAIFKKTLKYLNIRLQKAGYKCAIIYGDSNIKKNDILHQFQFDDSVQILLSSEVGSEGLDMQFCNSIVNYDLPWNPMVVEQRIGRIDRFGQESPKVNIYNIVVTESILENIYSRLMTRIGIFRESIGDLEAILDTEMIQEDGKSITIQNVLKNLERDFYSDRLSESEIKKKEKEIERAIENERLNLKNLEDGLTNALTNDSYFQNEIKKIEKHNAYVTSHELYQFIVQIIKEHLSTCKIGETETKGIYEFNIPPSTPTLLKRFLEQNEPTDIDSQRLFRRYIEDITDKKTIKLTFDQELAFKDKSISFVNLYHPIIRAGVKMFESKEEKHRCTFIFNLSNKNLPVSVHKGRYMLAIYKISVSRILFGDKPTKTESLYPILFDIEYNCIVQNHEIAESFMGCSQVDGLYAPMDDSFKLSNDTINNLRYDLNEHINDYVKRYYSELQIRIDNSKKLRHEQTLQFYASRIKSYERNVKNQEDVIELAFNDEEIRKRAERILPVMRANLRNEIQKRDAAIERINKDAQLRVIENIQSLNLINVI